MNSPELDVRRFAAAFLIGILLGIVDEFLFPLRQKKPWLSDLLFLPALGYGWLYVSFAVCRGDIRLGYTLGLLVGALAWKNSIAVLFRPIVARIWAGIFQIFTGFFRILKKFFKKVTIFENFLFSSWKKWFTIVWSYRRSKNKQNGGVPYDADESCS